MKTIRRGIRRLAPLSLLLLLALAAPPRAAAAGRALLSPPMRLAFAVAPSVEAQPDVVAKSGGTVKLTPAGCQGAECVGYTQGTPGVTGDGGDDGGRVNSATAVAVPRAVFNAVSSGGAADGADGAGAGAPAPLARLRLVNGGAMHPQDLAVPIVDFKLDLAPLGLAGGPAGGKGAAAGKGAADANALPGTDERVSLAFRAMWTPGPGAAPNNAGVFSLVQPLPSARFLAYGVPHVLTVTGLKAADEPGAGDAGAVTGRRPWWNEKAPAAAGFGALVVPADGRRYAVDVLAELRVDA